MQIRERRSEAEFYAALRLLIVRSHELDADDLREIAEAVPFGRKRGRPSDTVRRTNVWAECFSFVGALRRGGKMGDPPLSKADAISWICHKHGMKRDAARKLYDDIQRRGP